MTPTWQDAKRQRRVEQDELNRISELMAVLESRGAPPPLHVRFGSMSWYGPQHSGRPIAIITAYAAVTSFDVYVSKAFARRAGPTELAATIEQFLPALKAAVDSGASR